MKKTTYFEDLKEGLNAAIDYEKGKIELRTTKMEIPKVPRRISKTEIKKFRKDVLHVSQPVLARALGVSPAAVKAWELGMKKPSGSSRRLIELLEEYPEIFQHIINL